MIFRLVFRAAVTAQHPAGARGARGRGELFLARETCEGDRGHEAEIWSGHNGHLFLPWQRGGGCRMATASGSAIGKYF